MFGNIGPWEIAVILIIALLVIGPSKLPEAGKSLGNAIRSFNQAKNGVVKDLTTEKQEVVQNLESQKELAVSNYEEKDIHSNLE